jgi:antitoxin component YwqK of YwqJK toxin-antitoxin module
MRKQLAIALCGLSCMATSCTETRYETALKETFLHKYGVPVTKEEWARQGEEGQIVRILRTGVTVTNSYENGELHGESSYTFPNSSVVERIETYEHGVLKSRRFHYTNGLAKSEEHFDKDLVTERRTWFEEGTPQAIEHFEEGRIAKAEYRSKDNEILSKIENGCGERLHRHQNGELAYKENYQGGLLVERVDYYHTGDPSSITPFENNHIHGTRLTFHLGGLPHTAEQWRYGVQEGPTLVYENGEKIAEVPYVNGRREGIEKRFREDGEIAEEVYWKADVQHGPRKLFVDQETKTEWYHKGDLVSRPTYERLNPPSQRLS